MQDKQLVIPLGIVIRRMPGVTRWSQWVWKPVAVLPGAEQANWKELRRDGEAIEYHAATLSLELFHTDTEAYQVALAEKIPCIYVVLREQDDPSSNNPLEVLLVTASPFEGQDYADTGEELVEKVPMPADLVHLISAFVKAHHVDEPFVKRKRDRKDIHHIEDGVGDPRIVQLTDVYRAPRQKIVKH